MATEPALIEWIELMAAGFPLTASSSH